MTKSSQTFCKRCGVAIIRLEDGDEPTYCGHCTKILALERENAELKHEVDRLAKLIAYPPKRDRAVPDD